MTIDRERWDTINWTRDLLYELMDEEWLPPKHREMIRRRLKHYPEEWWVETVRKDAKACTREEWEAFKKTLREKGK